MKYSTINVPNDQMLSKLDKLGPTLGEQAENTGKGTGGITEAVRGNSLSSWSTKKGPLWKNFTRKQHLS